MMPTTIMTTITTWSFNLLFRIVIVAVIVDVLKSLSRVWLFVASWTVPCQAPLSMWFSRQEYWSRLPFPSPGDLPNPGIKPKSPALQADSLPSEPPQKPWHEASPFDSSWVLPVGGGLLVSCSLPGFPVLKQVMQMVTVVPGQGEQFQCFPCC